jgi:hypothetical protein
MKRLFFILIILNLILADNFGQTQLKLSGKIFDNLTGESLVGASILEPKTNKGAVSDLKGYYSILLPEGKNILQISNIGYKTLFDTLIIHSDLNLDLKLESENIKVGDVVVTSQNNDIDIRRATTSTIQLNSKEIRQLPSLMGESDVLRLIQLSPGVQSANEGNSGFYVRGGGADQNLVLLDNATVFNPSHVMGFFSVFNSDVVKDVKLIKSGMSADYGGRMSSVIEINTLNGDYNKFHSSVTIGLISSKIEIEGPVIKDRISFVIAARRSYLDEVLKPAINTFTKNESSFYNNSNYYFYDLNAKISAKINNKNLLTVTFYRGKDYYQLNQYSLNYKNLMDWGNTLITGTYNKIFNDKWFLENTLSYTNYQLSFSASQFNVDLGLTSLIENLEEKLIVKRLYNNSIISFGLDYQRNHFVPNNLKANANGLNLNFGLNRDLYSHETAIFYNQKFNINNRIAVNSGLRFTYYIHTGPYTEYTKNEINEVVDTLSYDANELIKSYPGLEPRLTISYQLMMNSSIKASYTRHVQYIHLATASSVTLPTDVWLPSTTRIKPQKSDHYTIGYYQDFGKKVFNTSVEAYYKNLYNQIELLYGILNDFQDKIFEESMVFGNGRSYGIEFYVRKTQGKVTGWIGYTISRTEREFSEIDSGRIYPAKYDRTHDLNIVLSYALSKRWNFSGTFLYATGNAMTVPEEKYIIGGNVITGYSGTNSFRMPAYHRLDLSITYNLTKRNNFESSINFSVFNVYNRANPYFIYFEISGNVYNYNLHITPRQVTLFPIIPSVSWSFKF